MEKQCSKCQQVKSVDMFYKTSGAKCKTCHNAYQKAYDARNRDKARARVARWRAKNLERDQQMTARWREENPDKVRELKWRRQGIRISYQEYEALCAHAEDLCQICGREPKKLLVVDHCHKTGVVRGVLCNTCNTAIGLLQDSPESARKAAEYLQRTP